jgi:hypothetical protein
MPLLSIVGSTVVPYAYRSSGYRLIELDPVRDMWQLLPPSLSMSGFSQIILPTSFVFYIAKRISSIQLYLRVPKLLDTLLLMHNGGPFLSFATQVYHTDVFMVQGNRQ